VTQEVLQKIEANLWAVFSASITAGSGGALKQKFQTLSSLGLTSQRIQIEGGHPPPLSSLFELDYNVLRQWAESVSSYPTELKRSRVLVSFADIWNVKMLWSSE